MIKISDIEINAYFKSFSGVVFRKIVKYIGGRKNILVMNVATKQLFSIAEF